MKLHESIKNVLTNEAIESGSSEVDELDLVVANKGNYSISLFSTGDNKNSVNNWPYVIFESRSQYDPPSEYGFKTLEDAQRFIKEYRKMKQSTESLSPIFKVVS